MTWHQIPLVRLLFPLIIGIAVYTGLGACFSSATHLVAQGFCLGLLTVLYKKKAPSISFSRVWGMWLALSLFQLGYWISYQHDTRNHPLHLSNHVATPHTSYIATVNNVPKPTEKTIKLHLALQAFQDSSSRTINPIKGTVLAYIELDSSSAKLNYGDQILFQGQINSVDAPLNPAAFDARNYYFPKNIYQQVYIPSEQWKNCQQNIANPFWELIYNWRKRLLLILKQHLYTPNEYAVGSALILGAKDKLNTTVRNAYADTGAMHVLAVSGLHVGILIAMLNFLLGFVRSSNRWWNRTRILLLLFILWGFAFLTGASASVLRAATMFSFVLIGQLLHRKINIYNSLAGSAFLLLCINPFMLYDIGFQLSYLALLGVVFFHPKIYALWEIKNWLGNWIWNGIALALAAQIATLPISLYYFHQFPVFFWLSGLIVTAAAGIILGLGLALLVLNGMPFISSLLGFLLYSAIGIMNSLIFVIQKLPGAVWEGFWLEPWQMWILYAWIASLVIFIMKRRLRWAFVPLLIGILMLGYRVVENYQQNEQVLLCVYNSRKSTAVSFVQGKQMVTLVDSSLLHNASLNFVQQNHRWALGIQEHATHTLQDSIQRPTLSYHHKKGTFNQERLFLYGPSEVSLATNTPLEVDYVLIHGNPKLKSIQQIEQLCLFKTLIFDASNSYWKINPWTKECQALGIEYINVAQNGAWVHSFKQ